MKLSRREIVLLVLLVVVACGVGYYLLWFAPVTTRITQLNSAVEQKKMDIADAELREIQYGAFQKAREASDAVLQEYLNVVPYVFDEADVIRRVERIVTPFTTDIAVEFTAEPYILEKTVICPVVVNFAVPFDAMKIIFESIENDSTELRVINSYCELEKIVESVQIMEVSLTAEYLIMKGD